MYVCEIYITSCCCFDTYFVFVLNLFLNIKLTPNKQQQQQQKTMYKKKQHYKYRTCWCNRSRGERWCGRKVCSIGRGWGACYPFTCSVGYYYDEGNGTLKKIITIYIKRKLEEVSRKKRLREYDN